MARDLVRDDVVLSARTWVVKVGTSVLTGPDGTLDPARIGHLAEQISAVTATGRRVALVSSGAVGAGIGQLGLARRPDNLRQLQAAAAVGQAYLIRAYDEGFRRHGRHAAQLLLTHEDFDSRPRYLNMRNTLTALFEYDAVPVINENDTISVDEIKFGDNDQLAAMVTNLLQAPLLVILSVVDGLCRTDPGASGLGEVVPLVAEPRRRDPRPGRRQPEQRRDRRDAEQAPGGRAGHPGRRLGHHRLGQEARAADPDPRRRAGRAPSSSPEGQTQGARKRWIGLTARPRGHLVVDAGARIALEAGRQEPAGDRDRRGRRRVRQGGRRRRPRPRRPRVRPRPDQLPVARRPPDPRAPDRAGPPGDRLGPLRRGHPPG